MKYVYKFGAAALAILIIVIAVFTPLISIGIESFLASTIVTIADARGNEEAKALLETYNGQVPDVMWIKIGISTMFDEDAKMTAELIDSFSSGEPNITVQSLISPVVTFIVVLICIIICAVVTAILAIAAKNNRKVIYSSLAGIGLSLMLAECFEAISEPFLEGGVTLAKLAGTSWISLLGEIKHVDFNSLFWAVPVVFALIIVWTVLYNATLSPKDKAARKAMLGEEE